MITHWLPCNFFHIREKWRPPAEQGLPASYYYAYQLTRRKRTVSSVEKLLWNRGFGGSHPAIPAFTLLIAQLSVIARY